MSERTPYTEDEIREAVVWAMAGLSLEGIVRKVGHTPNSVYLMLDGTSETHPLHTSAEMRATAQKLDAERWFEGWRATIASRLPAWRAELAALRAELAEIEEPDSEES